MRGSCCTLIWPKCLSALGAPIGDPPSSRSLYDYKALGIRFVGGRRIARVYACHVLEQLPVSKTAAASIKGIKAKLDVSRRSRAAGILSVRHA